MDIAKQLKKHSRAQVTTCRHERRCWAIARAMASDGSWPEDFICLPCLVLAFRQANSPT
jgi:hypothetical protein